MYVFNTPHAAMVIMEMRPWFKVSKGAKIRNQYNQVPHLTQDTNGKVTNSHMDIQKRSQGSNQKYSQILLIQDFEVLWTGDFISNYHKFEL